MEHLKSRSARRNEVGDDFLSACINCSFADAFQRLKTLKTNGQLLMLASLEERKKFVGEREPKDGGKKLYPALRIKCE